MTQIQAGEGARFPHRRSPKGSRRERRSEGRATFTKKVRKLHSNSFLTHTFNFPMLLPRSKRIQESMKLSSMKGFSDFAICPVVEGGGLSEGNWTVQSKEEGSI
jgi:hypothetical protein